MGVKMYSLEVLKATRKKFIALIDSLSFDELNKIPAGFNNNIVWNFGHAIVSGYLLCYVSTTVDVTVKIPFVDKYRKGTKPETFVNKDEVEILKKASDDFFVLLEKDLSENKFQHITPYATQTFGVEMQTIEDDIITIFGHDTLHYTTAVNMKRIVK